MAPAARQRRRAAAACGGREKAARRMVGHRGVLGEGQQREARAAGELGGDTWSGAGAVTGLGRCGNGSRRRCCRTAEEVEVEEEQGVPGADL
jgi:hypothetical protein